jgi:enoyl-[acyl-carrier-protein] reductase (NADH)
MDRGLQESVGKDMRTLSSKLQLRYTGPYRVVKVINPVTSVANNAYEASLRSLAPVRRG